MYFSRSRNTGSSSLDMQRLTVLVQEAPIDVISWDECLHKLDGWSRRRESRVVFICNVHSIVTAKRDLTFRAALQRADLATPDGAPVAWMLRKLGFLGQKRINGPDLMWRYCCMAADTGESVFLYGASPNTLRLLQMRLRASFPDLRIAGVYSPPYRSLSETEDAEIVKMINESGAGTVWVGLGCPKQELWMDAHRGRINAVMIGVGAAFDYHAGTIKRAPRWMQNSGLEWAHRLLSEPRRLWRRYLVTNTVFVLGAMRQILSFRKETD